MYKWRSIPVLFVFALALFSCKKDKDVSTPVVSIHSPHESQTFSVFEEVVVNADITDDRKLEYVMVVLTDADFIPVSNSVTLYPDNSSFQLDLSYPLNDIHLESGIYYMLVKASDGTNEKNKFVQISITAAPKILECIYFVEPLPDKVLIEKMDTAGIISTVLTRPPDYCASALSSDERLLLLCGRYSENLVALNVNDMQEVWHVDVTNSPPFPYFENMVYDGGKLFVAYREGKWEYFNLSGFLITTKKTDTNWMPEHFLLSGDYLITSQKEISGLQKRLVVYYLSSTAVIRDYLLNIDVVEMFSMTEGEFLVFGNDVSQGRIQLHNLNTGYLTDPVVLPAGTISSVERLSEHDYAIALADDILVFNDDSGTISTLIAGIQAGAMRNEPLSGILYIVPINGGGSVKQYRWPGGQYLGTFCTTGTVSEILLQYNRE